MNLCSIPCSVPIGNVNMQMEIIYVQCNGGLKEKYSNVGPFDLYSKYTDTNTSSNVFTCFESGFLL